MKLRLIKTAILLMLFTTTCEQALALSTTRLVYLDPLFGGKDKGPLIARNTFAKTITFNFSQQLKQLLEAQNIGIVLSRDHDTAVLLEERIMMARSRGPNAYITLNVSKTKRACIWLYSPQQPQSKLQKEKQSVKEHGESIEKLLIEERIRESGLLANAIYTSIKQKSVPVCLEKGGGSKQFENSYILENVHSPVIIINFGVSDSASPYVLDSALMNEIVNAVSEGVKEYFAVSQPSK